MIEYYSVRNKETGEEIKAFNTLDEALVYCEENKMSPTYYDIVKVVM